MSEETLTPESSSPAAEMDLSTSAPALTFGSAPEAGVAVEVAPAPVISRGKIDRFGTAWGTGRRKTSVARVRIQAGSGKFLVNDRPMDAYFCVERDRENILLPLRITEKLGQVDIHVNVIGGGTTGQAGAIVLGIARALEALNPSLHPALAEHGFLTRDSRMVERKKYGYKKARRSFQFSKR
ncbi:30S ribosomal protein S9 [bacterium]|nr:30S ribosomal protein S9 [bacterium]